MAVEMRPHVRGMTAVLSAVSLALVFGAATGTIPSTALPRAPDAALRLVPHVNAAISLTAIGVIAYGWAAVRRGDVRRHRLAMLLAFGLFAAFLALYLYRVALLGPAGFAGPVAVERFVYWPVLGVHMTLAVVCVPLLWYVLLLGLTYPVGEIPLTRHPRIGRIAASLWLLSFALGVVVYALLYHLY